MKNILIYTFSTFPYTNDLSFGRLSVFKKINQDMCVFMDEIITLKPDFIIGVAKSTEGVSTIEKTTVNQFNSGKKVVPDMNITSSYELHIPSELLKNFTIRTSPTHSFCNLSMFKICHFLQRYSLNIPFVFIHIIPDDMKHLERFVETCWNKA